MKKVILQEKLFSAGLLSLFVFMLSSFFTNYGYAQEGRGKSPKIIEILAYKLNVREQPSLEVAEFTHVLQGQRFQVYQTHSDGWYQIQLAGKPGWISAKWAFPPITTEELKEFEKGILEGGQVELHEGIYPLSKPLKIDESLVIRGKDINKTYISVDHGPFVIEFSGGSISLSGLTVQYTGYEAADVIRISDANVAINKVAVTGGIKNVMTKESGFGLVLLGESKGIVRNSSFAYNEATGAASFGSSEITFVDNSFANNGGSGLSFWETSAGVAQGNTSSNNGLHGFVVLDQAAPKLVTNVLEENKQNGIAFFDQAEGEAEGNTVRNNGTNGFYTFDEASPAFIENEVTGNNRFAFNINGQYFPLLQNNRCGQNELIHFSTPEPFTKLLEKPCAKN